VTSGQWPDETALEQSRKENDELLPQGIVTPDNHFYTIVNERRATVASVLLAACGAPSSVQTAAAPEAPASTAAAGSGDDLICTREYPTGSNIPVRKCRTLAQIEADKAASTESLRRVQAGGPNAKLGGNQ
jgi:hypothetical protein